MDSNKYRTFNPVIDNPVDRLEEAVESLEFLAGTLEQTATEDIDMMLVASRQRGLAHILGAIRREIEDVTRFMDDNGVDKLVRCSPRREHKDAGKEAVSLLLGMIGRQTEEAQQPPTDK